MSSSDTLAVVARRIRELRPILGVSATDEDCAVRRSLIERALADLAVKPGSREWFAAQLADGRIVGIWALSPQEAELGISIWWGRDCLSVERDPDLDLRREYFPKGKRTGADADRTFPIGPPGRIRDHFAPTESLLVTLHLEGADSSMS